MPQNPASRAIALIGVLTLAVGSPAHSQSLNIKNDTFWDTMDGEPIYSQGGGLPRFKDPKTDQEKYGSSGVLVGRIVVAATGGTM